MTYRPPLLTGAVAQELGVTRHVMLESVKARWDWQVSQLPKMKTGWWTGIMKRKNTTREIRITHWHKIRQN